MKFGEKYELLESLTTGAIETFAANDKIRDERVLVHIVDCATQKPDQATAEWVLESFRRLAPEPPGPVLETGKYTGTKYGYVVTKPADEAAVKAWVQRYELQVQETKETKIHALKPEISVPIPTENPLPMTPDESAGKPGSMTQLFRDFDSLAKSKPPDPPITAEISANRPAPSTSLPGESGLHPAVPWEPSSLKSGAPPREAAVPPAQPKPIVPEMPPVPARDSVKPGEFTSFFQGPFRADSPSEMPAPSAQPIEPPKRTVGEFTALFGQAAPSTPVTPAPTNASEPSFTGLFKDMATPPPTYSVPPSVPNAVVPPSQPANPAAPLNVTPLPDPVFVAPPPSPVTLTPAMPPAAQMAASPVAKPAPPLPTASLGDGATGAFMQPTAEPTPIRAEAPIGPSPYTQIISRANLPHSEETAGTAPPAATGSAGAGKFAAPPMPKIPAAAPPPIPKAPVPPPIPPAPMPKMTVPAAPKLPNAEVPTQPPVSYWPLIITLTVLFFLAVLLVLYFVLKH